MNTGIQKQFVAASAIIILLLAAAHAITLPPNVKELRNVVYVPSERQFEFPSDKGRKQTESMDIYYPANALTADKFPCAIFVHGGGLGGGSKDWRI